MRSSTVLSILSALTAASAQSTTFPVAPKVTNNPQGASYVAEFPYNSRNSIVGSVTAQTVPGGEGVNFALAVGGFPTLGGPFLYHIHAAPVPTDGNCTGTGAHLDPTNRGETPACDASAPATCQVGDLAGKYGTFNDTAVSKAFTDPYVSLNPNDASFFGNLSIVFHYANKTRIACANWTAVYPGPAPSNSSSNSISSSSSGASSAAATGAPTGASSSLPTSTASSSNTTTVQTGTPTPTTPAVPSTTGNAAAGMFLSSGAVLAAVMAMIV